MIMTLKQMMEIQAQIEREIEAMDPCETCAVKGCICEYCDECDKDVNPYEHFMDWNENGKHFSDVGLHGLIVREKKAGN